MANNLIDKVKIVNGEVTNIRNIGILSENVLVNEETGETLSDILEDNAFAVDNKYLVTKEGKVTLNLSDSKNVNDLSGIAMVVGADSTGTRKIVPLGQIIGVVGDEGNINFNTTQALSPMFHASQGIQYGQGNAEVFGHVKLSDATDNTEGTSETGIAASAAALASLKTSINTSIDEIESKIATTETNVTNLTTTVKDSGPTYVTKAQYTALPSSKLSNNVLYYVN